VQEKFLAAADASVAALAAEHPGTKGRIRLVVGDITSPGLGLAASQAKELLKNLAGCFHLAAVYDLAVARDVVSGSTSRHEERPRIPRRRARLRAPRLRFDGDVSGTAVGTYRETDLDVGQKFKNLLRGDEVPRRGRREGERDSRRRLPARNRGRRFDDRETAKFDGPYYSLNAMGVLPSPGAFIKVGTGDAEVNLVPVDFVLEAIARLSTWAGAIGKTYHLTDRARRRRSKSRRCSRKRSARRFSTCPCR